MVYSINIPCGINLSFSLLRKAATEREMLPWESHDIATLGLQDSTEKEVRVTHHRKEISASPVPTSTYMIQQHVAANSQAQATHISFSIEHSVSKFQPKSEY